MPQLSVWTSHKAIPQSDHWWLDALGQEIPTASAKFLASTISQRLVNSLLPSPCMLTGKTAIPVQVPCAGRVRTVLHGLPTANIAGYEF